MVFHGFLFFLIFCLAWLWHLYWLRHNPLHSRGGAIHTTIQRLLKPRTPKGAGRRADDGSSNRQSPARCARCTL